MGAIRETLGVSSWEMATNGSPTLHGARPPHAARARGAGENVLHVGHCRGVPAVQGLVESGTVKHVLHVGHFRGVPAVQGLVECKGIPKHGTTKQTCVACMRAHACRPWYAGNSTSRREVVGGNQREAWCLGVGDGHNWKPHIARRAPIARSSGAGGGRERTSCRSLSRCSSCSRTG